MSAHAIAVPVVSVPIALKKRGLQFPCDMLLSSCMAEPPTPGSMDPREWARVREILHEALELSPDARSAYLDRACGGDAGLRAEVESLITASEGSAVLDRPAIGTVTIDRKSVV